jgi:hypothetical protein
MSSRAATQSAQEISMGSRNVHTHGQPSAVLFHKQAFEAGPVRHCAHNNFPGFYVRDLWTQALMNRWMQDHDIVEMARLLQTLKAVYCEQLNWSPLPACWHGSTSLSVGSLDC